MRERFVHHVGSLASPRMPTSPGRRFLILLLAISGLLVAPTVATTAGHIVIYGAASGAHLTLSNEGGRVVVKGFQSSSHPHGCRPSATARTNSSAVPSPTPASLRDRAATAVSAAPATMSASPACATATASATP